MWSLCISKMSKSWLFPHLNHVFFGKTRVRKDKSKIQSGAFLCLRSLGENSTLNATFTRSHTADNLPPRCFPEDLCLRLSGGLLCGRAMAGASMKALAMGSGWHSPALRTLERCRHKVHSCGSMNGSLKAQRLPLEQLNWRSSVCSRLFLTCGLKKKLHATFCCCCCSHRLNFLFAFWHLVEYNRTVEPHSFFLSKHVLYTKKGVNSETGSFK